MEISKQAIREAYEKHGGVIAAAEALGCSEATFRKLAHGYGVVLRPRGRPAAVRDKQEEKKRRGRPSVPCEIYGLYDPRDGALRYIGAGFNCEERLAAHISEGRRNVRSYKANWIAGLLRNGLRPECRVLVILQGVVEAARVERALIRKHREIGTRLTNISDGGESIGGVQLTPEALAKRVESQRAFYRTPAGELERERKRVLGRELKLGQVYSQESREKMRLAKLGKPQMARTPEWKAKIAAAQAGKKRRPWTAEERERHERAINNEKMSASAKARWEREKGQKDGHD